MNVLTEQTEKLADLLERKPKKAAKFVVLISAMGGARPVCEYEIDEIESETEVARRIVNSCDSWVSGTEKVFVGQWQTDSGRVLDTFKWRMNPENNGASMNSWDGSTEQLVGHLMGKYHEKDKMFLDLLKITFEFSQAQIQSVMDRNSFLEAQKSDTDNLREEIVRMEAELNNDNEDSARFNKLMNIAEKLLVAQTTKNSDSF